MSLSVTIDLRDTLGLGPILAALEDTAGLHEALAAAVEATVANHLTGLNSRSPNTGFYASAARGVEVESDASRGLVRIPELGFALRYYGGTVKPGIGISSYTGKLTEALAIPTDDVPIVGPSDARHRQRPGDAGLLAFIPNRKEGSKSIGFLIEGVEKTVTRGKNKGKTRTVPKPGGDLLYILAEEVTHNPDPSVLPTDAEFLSSAGDAAVDYIESFADEGGLA